MSSLFYNPFSIFFACYGFAIRHIMLIHQLFVKRLFNNVYFEN